MLDSSSSVCECANDSGCPRDYISLVLSTTRVRVSTRHLHGG
ncbi:hypothetical protein GLE_3107 [Lysobacter enzymogenes]|uniref:Uncharacterized protein n=2 Tax=Lysobacter enzymogenes TaxID=69 RepID=A0A0S2DII2_LYSEN|nr:hypothetical protein GLE_3107 [Lysobacter enzymogenes]